MLGRETLIAILIAGVFLTFGCQDKRVIPPMSPVSLYGDAIVVASIGDASCLVPIIASDSASHNICGMVFNGLVKYDKDIKITGDLAERWEVSDDGLVITFYLRRGVKWHDGEPFTARDVEFTYQCLINPAVPTPYSGDFERIGSLEIVDDYTVRVTYKESFAPALSSWSMWIMPEHILKGEDLTTTPFARDPIGTGPYRFKFWRTAERIDLTSNHDYFEGMPHINRYIYRVIPDQATMFLELRTESIDWMGLTPLQYTRQTDTRFFKDHYQRYRYPSFGYTYMGYNLRDPRFSDIRVRKAINLAINKEEIIEGVLYGLGRICTGPFPPESWAYNEEVKPAAYDSEKAEELLQEAGWERKGKWLYRDGERFEFTLITNQGNLQRQMVTEIIQKELRDLGIKVKLRIIEWSMFLREFIDKRKFDAVLLGWGLSRDPDLYDIWHSSKTGEGEFNFLGYENPDVDRLILAGRTTFDQTRRKEIYHRVHKIIYEEQPCCFLYVPDATPIVHIRFKGIEPAPLGIGYNFIDWYVPPQLRRYPAFTQ